MIALYNFFYCFRGLNVGLHVSSRASQPPVSGLSSIASYATQAVTCVRYNLQALLLL